MKINCYTTFADGYERQMRMFLNYYLKFCDNVYVVYDTRNNSNCSFLDNYKDSRIVYKSVNVRGTRDRFCESIKSKSRDEFYFSENSNCDWNIVVDCDEFIYSPIMNEPIDEFLSRNSIGDYFTCIGYNVSTINENNGLFFDNIPDLSQMKFAFAGGYCKPVVSRKGIMLKFGNGCHQLLSYDGIAEIKSAPLLIHTKFLNMTYIKKDYDEICLAWARPKSDGNYEHMRHLYESEYPLIVNEIRKTGIESATVFKKVT